MNFIYDRLGDAVGGSVDFLKAGTPGVCKTLYRPRATTIAALYGGK
jgi:hypothetical protein